MHCLLALDSARPAAHPIAPAGDSAWKRHAMWRSCGRGPWRRACLARACLAAASAPLAIPSARGVLLCASSCRIPAGVPGASDANADVTPLDAIGGNLEDTHAYAAQASYQQNLK